MSRQPIQLIDASLCFSTKICFEGFTATIPIGSRIGIIGQNGTGKTSLLAAITGDIALTSGEVILPPELTLADVPQIITNEPKSGAERFWHAFSNALAAMPDVLLLDEPTNHLDRQYRLQLFNHLQHYPGTLIIASHDEALLNQLPDKLWHLQDEKIQIFDGKYDDYCQQRAIQAQQYHQSLKQLKQQQKACHQSRMDEQRRAANSRQGGKKKIKQRKWPTIVSRAKADRANDTAGKKNALIEQQKVKVTEKLSSLHLPTVITPRFSLPAFVKKQGALVTIHQGQVGYDKPIIKQASLTISATERVAIVGNNGSGKSTFVKALLQPTLRLAGDWITPRVDEMGYLDQHYGQLNLNQTVLMSLQAKVNWPIATVRHFLSDFLFATEEQVNTAIAHLSGGERARLSLALIAAVPPRLLILDELTNNLDRETKTHVIEVLAHYQGALLVISHDDEFLRQLNIETTYEMVDNQLVLC